MRRRFASVIGTVLSAGLVATAAVPAAAHAEPVRAASAPAASGDLRADLYAILA
ncbi:MAG: hypothetical protein IRY90_18210, partial [Actinomadura rubrobrunea]|nr:hypothetical protein [Actinomadura rubrobrunea]